MDGMAFPTFYHSVLHGVIYDSLVIFGSSLVPFVIQKLFWPVLCASVLQ